LGVLVKFVMLDGKWARLLKFSWSIEVFGVALDNTQWQRAVDEMFT
jgi:hypothetical protein